MNESRVRVFIAQLFQRLLFLSDNPGNRPSQNRLALHMFALMDERVCWLMAYSKLQLPEITQL